jgi:hypothetical protein
VSKTEIVIEIVTVTVIVTEKGTGNVIKTGTVIGAEIETEIGTVIGTGIGIGTEKGVGGVIVTEIVTRAGIETGIGIVIVNVTEIGRETEIETGESLSITMRTDSKFLVRGETRCYLSSSKEISQRNQASWTGCVAWPMMDTLALIGMTAGML